MTTIAYKDCILATDSKVVNGNDILVGYKNKLFVLDNCVIASAEEAIKIASEYDCFTGGKINIYNFKEKANVF